MQFSLRTTTTTTIILSITWLLCIGQTSASPHGLFKLGSSSSNTVARSLEARNGDGIGSPVQPRNPANTAVNPNAVTGTTCDDPNVSLVTHDTNVALLAICGGIAGTIEFCGGNPATTVGASGTSKFTLTAVNAADGATINVSKGRWEGCVRAARATCPTGTFSSTCIGGTTDGVGFTFVLSQNE